MIIKGESSRRRRTRDSWATEVASIEIPILRPRIPTETQEPMGNLPMEATVTQEPDEGHPQLENL